LFVKLKPFKSGVKMDKEKIDTFLDRKDVACFIVFSIASAICMILFFWIYETFSGGGLARATEKEFLGIKIGWLILACPVWATIIFFLKNGPFKTFAKLISKVALIIGFIIALSSFFRKGLDAGILTLLFFLLGSGITILITWLLFNGILIGFKRKRGKA